MFNEGRQFMKNRRRELGLTMKEVATSIGIQEATYQRYETGVVKNIPYDKIIAISEILDCKPEELLGIGEQNDEFKPATRRQLKFALFGNPDEDDEILDDVIKLAKLQKMLRDNKEDK